MNSLKSLTYALLGIIISAATLSSCQDEDFGYTAEQIAYYSNFKRTFGDLSDIPTFDLSSYNLNRLGLEGGPSNNYATRAEGVTFIKETDTWFEVPDNLIAWLGTHLNEKADNRGVGTTNFTLAMPGNDLIIVPIYQGQAGLQWELWMNNGTIDEKIWTKSEGIMVRSATTSSGQTAYSNTPVGDPITINNVAFQQMGAGNGDFYVPIYSALRDAGFNPSTEWFSVTVSGVKNRDGSNYTGEGGVQAEWKTQNGGYFYNGSKTIDVKNEEVLKAWNSKTSGEMQLRLAIWQNSLNTSAIPTITVQRYQKTSTGTDYTWSELTATDFDNGHTIGKHIKTNAIRINRDQFAGQFELYLKVQNTDLDNGKWADREKQSSKAGQMIAITSLMKAENAAIVEATRREVIKMFGKNEYEIMFLGCEDSNTTNSDWDMNDVCFLIIGRPDMPPILEGEDKYYSKRYLIEDLGSTFDFDFNDIVVDVEEVVCTHSGNPHNRQTATLKHLCGTIPFQIGFGDIINDDMKWFDPMPGNNNGAEQGGIGYTPTGSPYSSMLVGTDNLAGHWNRNANNIYVRVWPSQAGATPASNAAGSWTDMSDYLCTLPNQTFTFPAEGQYPYIIATDQNIHWMRELITIPTSWFTVVPKNDNPQYGQGETPTTPETTYYAVSVTTSVTGGTATISPTANAEGKYATGTEIILTATPATFYEFVKWTKDGVDVSGATNATYQFTLNSESQAGNYAPVFNSISTTYTIGQTPFSFTLAKNTYSVRVEASNFSNLVAGDQITIRCDNSNGKNIYIKAMNAWGTNVAQGTVSNNEYTFTVTNDMATAFKQHGMAIQSSNNGATVTSVTITNNSGNGGTSPVIIPEGNNIGFDNVNRAIDWSSNNENTKGVIIRKSDYDLTNHVGEDLIVHVSEFRNGAKAGIRYADNNWTKINDLDDFDVEGDFRIIITENMVNNGIRITGTGYTISKITLACSGHNSGSELLSGQVTASWSSIQITPQEIDWTGKTKVIVKGTISDQYVRLCATNNNNDEGFLTIAAVGITWTSNHFKNDQFVTDLTEDLKTNLSKTFYLKGSGKITSIVIE